MSPIRINSTFTFTALLWYALIGICLLLFLLYILFQARFLISGPKITLLNEPTVQQTERRIHLEGFAENITAITINDRPIVTNEVGYFNEAIMLENGYTIVSIKAHDRYGREISVERSFVYIPESLLLN